MIISIGVIGLLVGVIAGVGYKIVKALKASAKAQQDIALALQILAQKSKEEKKS